MTDLKSKISKLWKTKSSWTMVSLGKGCYEFCFSSLDDLRSVRSIGSWRLSPGLLRIFAWSPDFNPNFIRQTNAQIWVRFHGLSREYWRPTILFEIAGAIGTPIALDESTMKRSFGHFARVLIDIDVSATIRDRLRVERDGFEFFTELEYERFPPFCHSCQTIGHNLETCKHQKPLVSCRDAGNNKKTQQFVPISDSNKQREQRPTQQVYAPNKALPQLVESTSGLSPNNKLQDNLQVQEDDVNIDAHFHIDHIIPGSPPRAMSPVIQAVNAVEIAQEITHNVVGSDNEELVFEEPSPSHISDSLQAKDNNTGLIDNNAALGDETVSNAGSNLQLSILKMFHSPVHVSNSFHGLDSEEDSDHYSLPTHNDIAVESDSDFKEVRYKSQKYNLRKTRKRNFKYR